MFSSRRKPFVIGLVTVVLVSIGGVAFAFWTAGGSGSATASTGSTVAVTVNQTSTVTDLRPGGAAQTLSGNFTNTNAGPVYVTSVTASIAGVTKASGAPSGTCDATDYVLASATMTVNAEVPSGANQGSWTGATLRFNNKTSNQDGCKGATVNLSYAVS